MTTTQPLRTALLAGVLLTLTACADGADLQTAEAGPVSPSTSSPAGNSSSHPSSSSSPAAREAADANQPIALNGVTVDVPGSWVRDDGRCDWLARGGIHLQPSARTVLIVTPGTQRGAGLTDEVVASLRQYRS